MFLFLLDIHLGVEWLDHRVTLCSTFCGTHVWDSLVAQMVKCLPAMQKIRFDPWVGKIPWRSKWQPTAVLLPRKFHGWRSLVGYSPLMYCFPNCLHHFTFHQQHMRVLISPHPCQHLILFVFLSITILVGIKCISLWF